MKKIYILYLLLSIISCTTTEQLEFGIIGEFDFDTYKIIIERVKIPAIQNNEIIFLEGLLYFNPEVNNSKGAILTHGRNGPHPKRNKNEIFGYRNLNLSLVNQGYSVLFLVRRGYGQSQGSSYSEFLKTPVESGLAASQDIKAGIQYLKSRNNIIK